jgi:zinc protease
MAVPVAPRSVLCPPVTLAALAVLAVAAPAARADDPALRAAASLYADVRTETLPNGLRVFLKPIPGAPTVTTMVVYKVGSADEELDHTGLSHYLEHLMFKGTDKLMPGDIDRLTQRNGGRNNAYTDVDLTNYHFDFAADRWETALEIEADRMAHLRIDEKHEFEQEKGAVISELEGNEDHPWELENKAILPLLFGAKAPMGHPVIGERQHVRDATAAVIKAHYDRWYHPNNAALVVVGGFDPERALARVRELFGPIPRAELPPRKDATQTERTAPARTQIPSKFETPRLLVGFNTVKSGEPDSYALEVIEGILSAGKTGRLYRKLVEEVQVASEVGASSSVGRYPGWFSVQVELLKGKDRQKVEELVLAELKRLADEPVPPAELERVRRGLVAGFVFGREDVHDQADSIARGVTTHDLEFVRTFLPRVAAVTAEDVRRVARRYLDPNRRVVVWSVPGEKGKQGDARHETRDTRPKRTAALSRVSCLASRVPEGAGAQSFDLAATQRVVLPNGLTLLLLENHRLPIVVAEALVKEVRLREPADRVGIAALTGRMLDEGTDRMTGEQIAEAIESVGGSLAMSPGGGSVKVLAPDRSLGLRVFLDCLSRPKFPADEFARQRELQLSEIDDAQQQANHRARQAFQALVYGDHPLGRPALGERATVEKLTPDACRAFHRSVFVPNNVVLVVVGDFDRQAVVDEITRLTADWKPAPLPKLDLPAPAGPKGAVEKIVPMPMSAQLNVYAGHLGVRRNDPDYYKLLVMDHVLGTGTGFTDRLSANLRDRQGLAYTVSGTISASAGEEPGTFVCYVGTYPDKFGVVKGGLLKELRRIREEPPAAEEVEDVKKYLLGSLPFRLGTCESVAEQLLGIERHGLGFRYLDDYRRVVSAVTPTEVQTVAEKHLHPDRLALVAAGAVDAQGKPTGGAATAPPPEK